jgi:gamma-glutamyl-gamma-aminobutyrate hydrolase PuuD
VPAQPRIGVTRWEDVLGEVIERYWARTREAGGDVVDLDESTAARVTEIAPQLDALILTGGADVDPARYGAERHEKVKTVYPERDAMELAFLEHALRRDIPVLAICRGHQVLNVGFGGSLLQHIDSGEHRADYRTEGYPSRWHDVRVDDACRLREVLGVASFFSNSRHHQAVVPDGMGTGLRAVAWADDHGRTLIEGVESDQHRWVVGVQWHPERLEEHEPSFAPLMSGLFRAFVGSATA